MIPSAKLINGIEIPTLGLGTWKMSDDEAEHAVRSALEIGYRHIDTAKLYGNERGVGNAVRASGLPREEIFVTTKLWPTDFFDPQKGFQESLARLDIGYVDLYLIHWPAPLMPKSIWRAMERIYENKKVRAIGVSNYGPGDLKKLLSYAAVPPVANQIQFSPFDFDKTTLDFCREKDIAVEAYSPLTRGRKLDDPAIGKIATKYGKSPAQIMIRWCIEHAAIPLPKSSNPDRMRENLDVFDFKLASEDVAALDSLT